MYLLTRYLAEEVVEDLEARGGPEASSLFALPLPPHQVLAWLQNGEVCGRSCVLECLCVWQEGICCSWLNALRR